MSTMRLPPSDRISPQGRRMLLLGLVAIGLTLLLLSPYLVHPQFRPEVRYEEKTLRLPGFDPLTGYVYGNNVATGDYVDRSDFSQIPVLSSDSIDPLGVYYVNNASELVRVSMNGTAEAVAPITLLYQDYAAYPGMLANEFWIEYAYDEALFFGTVSPAAPNVSVETVNLTTGAVLLLNTTVPITPDNQGALLIGNNLVLVVSTYQSVAHLNCGDCRASLAGFNLANGTSWTAGPDLPFFEANNLYWLPQKHQIINVEAHGVSNDSVQQLNESANRYGEPVFTPATLVTVDSHIVVNWVNGLGYNASSDRIAFSDGGQGDSITYVLGYDAQGDLTTVNETRYVVSLNGVAVGPQLFNGQRYVYTSNYVMGGFFGGYQYLFDPWNGSTIATNVPFTLLPGFDVCDGSCFLGDYAPSSVLFIDFHASVALNEPLYRVVIAWRET